LNLYKIHPIVVGTKVFDKGMMTYQHDYGKKYTIPIYSWYLEGGEKNILVDTPDGKAAITGFCVIRENFFPPKEIKAMEMEVIPPGTVVNVYESYDIMLKVKDIADILIPLHEPDFASVDTVSG